MEEICDATVVLYLEWMKGAAISDVRDIAITEPSIALGTANEQLSNQLSVVGIMEEEVESRVHEMELYMAMQCDRVGKDDQAVPYLL